MSARRILAVARRIAQGFRRDERTLGLVFVVPIVVTALLGWVLRDQKDGSVQIGIVNPAGAVGERIVTALSEAAAATGDPVTVGSLGSADAGRAALRDGSLDIVVVLPESLLADVTAGRSPVFTVVTEGTDPAAEGSAFGALQGLMPEVAAAVAPPGVAPLVPTIAHETVYLSPDADQVDVLAPVFLGYFGYFFVFLLTGISFLRERVGGTLERLLATPVTRTEIVLGYTLGFGIFATLQVIVLTAFILAHVDVPALGPIPAFTIGLGVTSVGSPVLAFLVALALSLGAVSLGIFLSTFARTELQIIQFIPIVIIPQGLLGGIFWPIEKLPDILQAVAAVLPMKYAVDALREVMLKGQDLSNATLAGDLAVLGAIAVVFVVLAALTIKREVV
jgi:ABC-2 type transport system permease protein